MAKSENQKVSRIKVKKKLWYKILSPKLFGQKEIGESYLSSPQSAVGRTLKINLKDLSGNVKDQNVYMCFKISGVDGNTLQTEVTGYQLVSAYVKRIVRKNINRLDDYFVFHTKIGERVVLKSLIVTLHKTNRSSLARLRKEAQALFGEEISKSDFGTFINGLVTYKVQSSLKKKLGKIVPLREIAVRVLTLSSGDEVPEPAVDKEKPEPPAEPAPAAVAEKAIPEAEN